jgi:Na+/alanine symporter
MSMLKKKQGRSRSCFTIHQSEALDQQIYSRLFCVFFHMVPNVGTVTTVIVPKFTVLYVQFSWYFWKCRSDHRVFPIYTRVGIHRQKYFVKSNR